MSILTVTMSPTRAARGSPKKVGELAFHSELVCEVCWRGVAYTGGIGICCGPAPARTAGFSIGVMGGVWPT
jgi:hypothetical protein